MGAVAADITKTAITMGAIAVAITTTTAIAATVAIAATGVIAETGAAKIAGAVGEEQGHAEGSVRGEEMTYDL